MPKDNAENFPQTTVNFWHDIGSLVKPVRKLIEMDGPALCDAADLVRREVRKGGGNPVKLTERILKYTDSLLTIQTRPQQNRRFADTSAHLMSRGPKTVLEEWLEQCCLVHSHERNAQGKGVGSTIRACSAPPACTTQALSGRLREFHDRSDEILMESLTGAWLALYFLGVPFAHPWERVNRLSDTRGGFPSGACVTKYIGDIYRTSRQDMVRERNSLPAQAGTSQADHDAATQILVLSYSPSALLIELIGREEDNRTPACVHQLGRCYALLQLRLYIRDGHPIKYFVTEESLTRNWKALVKHGRSPNQMFDKIAPWLRTVFPHEGPRQTVQLISRNAEIAGMSTCILGRKIGMYVLDTSVTPLPFAGNPIRKMLLQSYRTKLNCLCDGSAGARGLVELTNASTEAINERLRPILLSIT